MIDMVGAVLRALIHGVLWVMLLGAAASLWRWRSAQLATYSGVLLVLVARWIVRAYETTGVAVPRAILQAATIPLVATILVLGLLRLARRWPGTRRIALWAGVAGLLASWLVFKFTGLRTVAVAATQGTVLSLQNVAVLGYSYTALKLGHLLFDGLRGVPTAVRGSTLAAMVLFPPTYAQGPMHRYEEFAASFDALPRFRDRDWNEAVRRLVLGTFKATVVAPYLGTIALPVLGDPGAYGAAALWAAVYAYALMIYLDFSGLSDVAIGWGAAFGVKVPENFQSPYLQNNIQQFWQTWHMTLTRWLQAYVFMPLSRRLMKAGLRARPRVVMFVGYVTTFTACGLWHGESANFLVWGAYHGLGLFAYTALPPRFRAPSGDELRWTLRGILWWLGTFHFVCIGWVLFACPLPQAWTALGRMLIP